MKLTIGHLFPDLLNLYGDRGNIQCMVQRLRWRGIDSEVKTYSLEDNIDFENLDIILLGGGSDREQMLVCNRLKEIKDKFKSYVLGKYYETDDGKIDGLDIVDIYTAQEKGRLINNIFIESDLCEMPIVGFENHGGRTYINKNKPLGKVVFGKGNNGKSGYEGVVYKNVIGTYLHGPLLPKNPQLCDYLLTKALERKYGELFKGLSPLEDKEEKEANKYIVDRYSNKIENFKERIRKLI